MNSATERNDSLYIIDGSSLLYRAYYGLTPMQTSKGEPVQAIYGFCRAIKKIIDDMHPEQLVIVWDSSGQTMRKKIYQEYKAQRSAAPSDLFAQKEAIQSWASDLGIAQIMQEGWEADDLIATLVSKHADKKVVIIGPDKDLHQLASDHCSFYDPLKKQKYALEDLEKKYGFHPSKLTFFYALLGDTSDNIPGVKGIGEKGATELVQEFNDLDDLYKKIDQVKKERIKKALQAHEADARLSLQLFTLAHPEFDFDPALFRFNATQWEKGYPFFVRYEFKSLLPVSVKSDLVEQAKKEVADHQVHLVTSVEQLKTMCEQIKKTGICAIDTETNGILAEERVLVGASFAYNDQEAYYLPLRHKSIDAGQQIELSVAIELIRSILADASIKKIFHHAKFDLHVFATDNVEVKGLYFDTVIAASLLRKGDEKIGLKALSERLLGETMESFSEAVKGKKMFSEVALQEASSYAGHDALQTFKLWQLFQHKLEENPELFELFFELEMPTCEILFRMEEAGILLDLKVMADLKVSVDEHIALITEKIFNFLSEQGIAYSADLNLNSPRQIETLLFDDLGLEPTEKSAKGARSTKQEVLEKLSLVHPIPKLLLQLREFTKLKNTYVDPLPLLVNPQTGRIHTSYNQTAVATGRLSSNDPNLQNIPVSHAPGCNVRSAFVAKEGYSFISADYSQIELRVLAQVTQDPVLKQAFLHNEDIHARTAAQIFHVDLSAVTVEQREVGKRINFSVMYGMTPYGLSKDLSISFKDAKLYIDAFFERYHGIREWFALVIEEAKKNGFVKTWWGRRRYIPELQEKNKMLFEAGARAAINTPVQGTSSEIIKWAMFSVDRYFLEHPDQGRMLMQIHDELVFEVKDEAVEKCSQFIRQAMEQVVDWDVPLKIALRVGKNWAEVTK